MWRENDPPEVFILIAVSMVGSFNLGLKSNARPTGGGCFPSSRLAAALKARFRISAGINMLWSQ